MGNALHHSYRKTAIYGRVSTEHEAQLSAFENQRSWYEGIAQQHPDWVIVERYYDEGITGTAAQKRPAFMKMIEDAHSGKFDLIITREVCRFARNTVDTLTVTRELSKIGVEVYFISDNIWTMDGDGELRLTLMATLAQEESRKISERVRAGQKISREKGVLYGTGNILGYDLISGNYVINEDQAYVVRKVFELYASGLGYKRICAELTRLGCKNTHGTVEWKVDRIGRILRNATYKGFIGYNKSHSDGYLTQKRINHRDEEHIYVRGNFEPIVSESLWDHCAELRSRKSSCQRGEDGRTKKFGRKEPQSVWTSKLRCSCGSSFRRFLWHKNTNGTKTYGYECYRQKRTVSSQYLEKNRLDLSLTCHQKSIPFWHIDLMAYMVFEAVWKERKDAVLLACQMIEECAIADSRTSEATLTGLKQQLAKLQKQQEGLRGMCALGDISREEFLRDNQQIQEHIKQLEARIEDLSSASPVSPINMKKIRGTLDQWVDLAAPVIPDHLIDQFILQVIVVDDTTYNWTLNLSSNPTTGSIAPSEIARRKYHESRSGGKLDPHLNSSITNPQEVFSFAVTESDARDYCRRIGLKFFAKKWQDKQVLISI